MTDSTANIRRALIVSGQTHEHLESVQEHDGPTWTTEELARDFDVTGFLAPFVVVKRKSDGQKGTLEFTHSPRVYFSFVADRRP